MSLAACAGEHARRAARLRSPRPSPARAARPTANSAKSAPEPGGRRPGARRARAPPSWRSSTARSGEPEPGPATSTSDVDGLGGQRRRAEPSPTPGVALGVACRRTRAGAGIVASVDLGLELAQRRELGAGLVAHVRRPRRPRASGRAGARGYSDRRELEDAAEDVTSSGASRSSRARRRARARTPPGPDQPPAKTSVIGKSLNSMAVTTPKLPPPPRSAKKRSGSWVWSTRRTRRRP